jgi:hypothetical protein
MSGIVGHVRNAVLTVPKNWCRKTLIKSIRLSLLELADTETGQNHRRSKGGGTWDMVFDRLDALERKEEEF